MGFPGDTSVKETTCQWGRHKRHGFDPWAGKIPWRRAWQPTPVFLPGESPWTEKPGGLLSTGLERAGHDWSNLTCMHTSTVYQYQSPSSSHLLLHPHFSLFPLLVSMSVFYMCVSTSASQIRSSIPETWFSFKKRLDENFWRRQWQPTPVLLPGKSHGWRSLVGCSPWGH